MAQAANTILTTLGLAVTAGVGVTLGMMVVCRLLKWSPVNITINNYQSELE